VRVRKTAGVVPATFQNQLTNVLATKEGQAEINGLVSLILDIMDQAITDGDTYLQFGVNKARTKVLITLKEGNSVSYAVGTNLIELIQDAHAL